MKKKICILLCMVMVFAVFAFPAGAATDIKEPTDVPKVFITTSHSLSRDYIDCTVEIVDEEGGTHETILDAKSKIKIRGNSTSSGEKKPFNIKFSGKTDVLGMGKNKKWCLLANCYEKTLIRNQTVFDLAETIGLSYTPSYRVVDVYHNNKYLGSYLLTDAVEASESRVDIDTDANEFILERDARTDEGTVYFTTQKYGIRLGINEPEEPTDAQYNWLMDFLKNAENALAGGNYNEVKKYFDIDSMVDFYIVLELFKNVDVDTGSTRFHVKGDKIYGGPCWDFDLSSGNCSSSYYTTYNNVWGSGNSWEGLWCNRLWFRPLLNYSEFRKAVYDRYLELQDIIVNLFADNLLGENYIDRTVEKYWGTISRNYNEAGWKIAKIYSELERVPDTTYEANLEYYREWLSKRNEWLLDEWGLSSLINVDSSSGITQDGFFLSGIGEKTKVSELLKKFAKGTEVNYSGSSLSGSDYVTSGSCVTVGGANYTVLIRGDISADGIVDKYDYILVKRVCMNTYTPNYIGKKIIDVNNDGEMSSYDYILVKRHVFGTINLFGGK